MDRIAICRPSYKDRYLIEFTYKSGDAIIKIYND
jgi:hypothetical protein